MDATIGLDTLLMPLKTSRSVPNDPIVASGGHIEYEECPSRLRIDPPGVAPSQPAQGLLVNPEANMGNLHTT